MKIQAIRTDDRRFDKLPGFPWEPHYIDDLAQFTGLRLHYLDENSDSKTTFLCLHGQPTWSYVYRRMISVFLANGHRVVAPDFYGFGRSDKPIDEAVYTFDFHRETLNCLIRRLDLTNIVLVCQDWGGALGLTLPMDSPERFRSLFVMDTLLCTGEPLAESFLAWRDFANRTPDMDVGRLLKRGCPHLSDDEIAAYNAPFPDASYKAGVRRFPNLVPDAPNAPGTAISRRAKAWLEHEWSGTSFVAIGPGDSVLLPESMRRLAAGIRNCPAPLEVAGAGHFVQEWGQCVAQSGLESLGL